MKIRNIIVLIVVATTLFSSCSLFKKDPSIKNQVDTVSYVIGTNIGKDIMNNLQRGGGVDTMLNMEVLMSGIEDVFDEEDLKLDIVAVEPVVQAFFIKKQQEVSEKMRIKNEQLLEKNKAEGEEFLTKNKEREEIIELPSGLQYEVLVEGKGPKPQPGQKVSANYHGTLLDGTVFDSSVNRGKPFTFTVGGRVISGWNEAIQLMRVGSKWKIYLPYQLAYGERGSAGIEPGATLIFELELLDIVE